MKDKLRGALTKQVPAWPLHELIDDRRQRSGLPLKTFIEANGLCIRTIERYLHRETITLAQADPVCIALESHPVLLWPEQYLNAV